MEGSRHVSCKGPHTKADTYHIRPKKKFLTYSRQSTLYYNSFYNTPSRTMDKVKTLRKSNTVQLIIGDCRQKIRTFKTLQ